MCVIAVFVHACMHVCEVCARVMLWRDATGPAGFEHVAGVLNPRDSHACRRLQMKE